jgi:hypothetical protein
VCVLAMNLNIGPLDLTNLTIGFEISLDQYLPALRAGRRGIGGSRVVSAVARTAAGLLDVLDGKPVIDRDPVQLADAYARIAQLQAVKCIPVRERSAPSRTMRRECPRLLLCDELDVLKPSILVALGSESQRVVEQLGGYDPLTGPDPSMGNVRRGDYTVTAYGVAHPASRRRVRIRDSPARTICDGQLVPRGSSREKALECSWQAWLSRKSCGARRRPGRG